MPTKFSQHSPSIQSLKILTQKASQDRRLQVFLIFVVLFFILLVWFIFFHKPTLDPTEIYTDRLEKSSDALTIIQNMNEMTSPEGDVEQQISADDYETYLAIENAHNQQELQKEYGESIGVGQKIQEIVNSHEQSIAERGGIVNVQDMIALDTLPIKDKETRAVLLKNMGVTEQEYVRIRNEKQNHQERVKNILTKDKNVVINP